MGLTNTIRLWTDALITGGTDGTDLAPRTETIPLDVTGNDQLFLLPREDDQGVINVGDGTKDMDVKVFVGSTDEFVILDVGNSRVDLGASGKGLDVRMFGATTGSKLFWDQSEDTLNLDAAILGEHRRGAPVTKTSDTTLVESDSGAIFDNTGDAGAIIWTLPDVTLTGWHAWFMCVVDEDFTILSANTDKMIVDDDDAADSIGLEVTTQQIGGGFYVLSDGAKWLVAVFHSIEDTVIAIAT